MVVQRMVQRRDGPRRLRPLRDDNADDELARCSFFRIAEITKMQTLTCLHLRMY